MTNNIDRAADDAGELVFTRLSEVRFLALALLAAADHAEEASHAQDD